MQILNIKELERFSPFAKEVWALCIGNPITKTEVKEAVVCNRLLNPKDVPKGMKYKPCTRKQHIERVAWLVVNGFDEPITVKMSATHPIIDGNHRLAAAIIRGESTIRIKVSNV